MVLNESLIQYVPSTEMYNPAYFNQLVTITSCKQYASSLIFWNKAMVILLFFILIYTTYSAYKRGLFHKEDGITRFIGKLKNIEGDEDERRNNNYSDARNNSSRRTTNTDDISRAKGQGTSVQEFQNDKQNDEFKNNENVTKTN